jgi:formylglycine-generating enzyme required for sulfatase activity
MRNRPFYWDDHERANPIFPVVGVCWFEAEAYAKWLDAQLQENVLPAGKMTRPKDKDYRLRLVTEEEWERAGRGVDGREYPWEGKFDFGKANVGEELGKGIGTTAVCTYPLGQSPVGAWDMSGNVWEWTATSLEKYRVLRGGSWLYNARDARCASRSRDVPVIFYFNVGLRMVLSLASSEF